METLTIEQLDTTDAPKSAAKLILTNLQQFNFFSGAHNLLILSGGSCIDVAYELVQILPISTKLNNTSVALADERWVAAGSPASNEQQLKAKGVIQALEKMGATFVSVLGIDENPVTTAKQLNSSYKQLLSESENIVLLAGMGPDGHTLGILPKADSAKFLQKFSGENMFIYYELDPDQSNPFKQRFTMTYSAVAKATRIFLYASGESKREALQHFYKKDQAINKLPVLGLYLTENEPTVLTDITI